jgi:serine protease Do
VLRFFAAFVVSFGLSTHAAVSFTADQLPLEFDARYLTADEKRFLQAGLAFAETYNAMIDGAWGNGSQQALEVFSIANGGAAKVTNADVLFLALETYGEFEKFGWVRHYNSGLDLSFLVPTIGFTSDNSSENFVNFSLSGSTLGYSVTVGDFGQMDRLHEFTEGKAAKEAYRVRRSDVWITSSRSADGVSLYTRSDFRKGGWSTIMLSAADADAGALAAVSGSIAPGYAPQIGISPGALSNGITTLAALLEKEETGLPDSTPTAVTPPPSGNSAEPEVVAGFGTGFLVSANGEYLTNSHVVTGCSSVAVDGISAIIIADDPAFDLALLRVSPAPSLSPARFAEKPARLNSDVTVVGYPLPEILGGINVTRGAVTSLKGIGGDGVRMQISAPVQPGNSGGPVLNAAGQVVGVVVSKLDAQIISEATGDIPQNVNFAIRAEIAKLFLYQNGIEPTEAPETEALPPEEIADQAEEFTKLISCN